MPLLLGLWPEWTPTSAQADAVLERFALLDPSKLEQACRACYAAHRWAKPDLARILERYGALGGKAAGQPQRGLQNPLPSLEEWRPIAAAERAQACRTIRALTAVEAAEADARAQARGLAVPSEPLEAEEYTRLLLYAVSSRIPLPLTTPSPGTVTLPGAAQRSAGQRTGGITECQAPPTPPMIGGVELRSLFPAVSQAAGCAAALAAAGEFRKGAA